MIAPIFFLASVALNMGKIYPIDLGGPSDKLVHAARMGNIARVRQCFLDHDLDDLDLNSALDAAASYAHADIVEFLVRFGATDLESALLSAAARDHVRVVAYLISKDRRNPATNTRQAQTLASNLGAYNCDWLLTAHRWKERQ